MKIPSNPQISDKVMEKFLNGDKPPAASETKGEKLYNSANKKAVKMYNVPFPIEVHKQAKINAFNEGISLAEYLIRAVAEANERYKKGSNFND